MSNVHHLVQRQLNQERAEPAKTGNSMAFLALICEFCDDAGDLIRTQTWTCGHAAAPAVLRRWKRENPVMASSLVEHVVLTAGRHKVVYDGLTPLGPRVKVRDRALERAAVGL